VTPLSSRIVATATALAGALGVATMAAGASWSGPVYPKNATSGELSLAVAPGGRATVLFAGPKGSIGVISRRGAGTAWPRTAGTWLAGNSAAVRGNLTAALAGTQVGALWTTGRGGTTLRAAGGTLAKAEGPVKSRTARPRITRITMQSEAVGPQVPYTLASSAGQSSGFISPGVAARRLPAALPGTAEAIPAGLTLLDQDSDSQGNATALVQTGPTSIGTITRGNGGAWSAVQPIPLPLATFLAPGTATDLDVDPAGNAVVAVVTPSGTSQTVAVVQRMWPSTTFSAPLTVGNTGSTWFGGFGGAPPVTAAISPKAVVVGWGFGQAGLQSVGGGVAIASSIAAPGQPFPPATITNIGSTETWSPGGTASAATPSGMGAVLMWGSGAQGDAQDLGAVTSAGPGQPWSGEFNLAGRHTVEEGYRDVQLVAFNSGFVAAWSACTNANETNGGPCLIGVAGFR